MRKSKTIIGIVASIAICSVAGASAATLSPAQVTYNKSMVKAKSAYLLQVKPAQDAVLKAGKVLEAKRRGQVAMALAKYNAVIVKAKAPVVTAEAQYRVALKASIANPADASLKSAKTNAIARIAKATLTLKKSTAVSVALKNFNIARIKAFKAFKASLVKSIASRSQARSLALAKYNIAKKKAVAILAKANKTPTK